MIIPACYVFHRFETHVADDGSYDGHLTRRFDFTIYSVYHVMVKLSIGKKMLYYYLLYCV